MVVVMGGENFKKMMLLGSPGAIVADTPHKTT